MAVLNIWHRAIPSTSPACTPKPMMRRVNWSMMTSTQLPSDSSTAEALVALLEFNDCLDEFPWRAFGTWLSFSASWIQQSILSILEMVVKFQKQRRSGEAAISSKTVQVMYFRQWLRIRHTQPWLHYFATPPMPPVPLFVVLPTHPFRQARPVQSSGEL